MGGLAAAGLGLALLTLTACGTAVTDAPPQYCLSGPRDGADNYIAAQADEIAERVLNGSLVVVRDYNSQRYQLARRVPSGTCDVGELAQSVDDLTETLRVATLNATYPASDSPEWCEITTPITNVTVEDGSGLLLALGLSGLKGVIVVTDNTTNFTDEGDPSGSAVSVRAVGDCAAVQNLTRAMLSRRSAVLAFHSEYLAAARESSISSQ